VILRIVRTRIVVDLSDRRVLMYRWGKLRLSARVAVGTSATPTPLGRFYVNQRLIPTNPYGPFGVGAVGISAFSNVLTGWTQGGPVAIHGTNQPGLLGRQVSNGCIRVHNETMRRMFWVARPGTPVTIRR
jgi:lipoprotein-anchoring transpeptidase ErfK/SrfK